MTVTGDSDLLVTPETQKFRIDEITTNGMVPFEATPLETVFVIEETLTVRNKPLT